MLAMDDTGALLRFVQRSNDIDLREGEAALRARGRYSELVALYQHRGQHEAALDLLHTLTSSPQDLPVPPSGVVHHHCSALHKVTGNEGLRPFRTCSIDCTLQALPWALVRFGHK